MDCLPYEHSFAASEKKKRDKGIETIAIWDYEANAPLTPEMVMPFSEKMLVGFVQLILITGGKIR